MRNSPERRASRLPPPSGHLLCICLFKQHAVDSVVSRLPGAKGALFKSVYRPILGTSWLMRSRASSMTTALPRITTMPMRTFSPPAFSSNASSSTMLRYTCVG